MKYTDIKGEEFPDWADALGWMMTFTVIVAIIGGAIVTLCLAEGDMSQVNLKKPRLCNIHRFSNL